MLKRLAGNESWTSYWDNFKISNSKKATYELTVKKSLELIKNVLDNNTKKDLVVLDLGCGQSDIGILFSKLTGLHLYSLDINKKALDENILVSKSAKDITLIQADAYKLPFKNESFDVIISFGYGSVATYAEVQPEVYRVLKINGILLSDFQRHYNIYNILIKPKHVIRQLERYIKGDERKIYHFGIFGIKKYFRKYKLFLLKTRLFNIFPPLENRFSKEFYIWFENKIGMFIKCLLARVFIAKFKKGS